MALLPVVESLDEVPEALRGEYREEEGKFVLDLDVDQHPGVARLKGALDKERKAHRAAESALRKAAAAGDPEEVAEKLARLEELERQAGGDKGADIKAMQEKWRAEAAADRAKVEAERDALRDRYHKVALDDRLKSLALKAGVFAEDVDDVLTLVRGRFALDEDGEVFLRDKDGAPSSVTPDKFFAEKYRDERPKFYQPRSGSGTGTPPHRAGRSGQGADLTPVQKIARGLETRSK